jgi:sugar phosphate isomerase/epimerase
MKPAFSTVAVPDWTLRSLAQRLEAWGYMGCELRTSGTIGNQFASDPALTAPAKVREMFDTAGVAICTLATPARFDRRVTPTVIGHVISQTEHGVPLTRGAIDMAIALECPFVRVFAYELPEGESRASGSKRIAERLQRAADYCRNSGVRLLLENGGSYARATDIAELLDRVDEKLVQAAYSPAIAQAAGEDPKAGINVLGGRLQSVKLKDMSNGRPVALGTGELACESVVKELRRVGFGGWVVYEYDRAWLSAPANIAKVLTSTKDVTASELGAGTSTSDVDSILAQSSRTLFGWIGQAASPLTRERIARA